MGDVNLDYVRGVMLAIEWHKERDPGLVVLCNTDDEQALLNALATLQREFDSGRFRRLVVRTSFLVDRGQILIMDLEKAGLPRA